MCAKRCRLWGLVCQFEGCNFFVVLRDEEGGTFVNGEKQSPMFKIIGTSNMLKKSEKPQEVKKERMQELRR